MCRKVAPLVAVLVLVGLVGVGEATHLKFRLLSEDNVLQVGDTAVVTVWAWADEPEAAGLNGLNEWGADMVATDAGVMSVASVTILEPAPFVAGLGYDSIVAGEIFGLGAEALNRPQDSTVGVGDWTKVAVVELTAATEGMTTYMLENFFGVLRDGETYCEDLGSAILDFGGSNAEFTVVPEPMSLGLLAGLGLLGLRRRWGH